MFIIPADTAVKRRVEDVMPIATGHEKEELEAELEVLLCLILIWVHTDDIEM